MTSNTRFPEFKPRWPWFGADLQTLRNTLRGPAIDAVPSAPAQRLELPMEDGTGDRLVGFHSRPTAEREDAPLIVLVHGLGGTSESTYIEVTAAHLKAQGYPILRLNLRGAGASRPLCREQYHAGRSQDLRAALAALPARVTPNGAFAVGYSLGGNLVLKYAAEFGGLRGAASISAPIDLAAASARFLDNRNRIYLAYLLNRMKAETLEAAGGITREERETVQSVKTILEFDERIVAPRNGFEDAADYYRQNHARQFLAEIEHPTLLMHALDDPWIPAAMYTSYSWSLNPNLTPLLPHSGGHVGFHSHGDHVPWHDQCLSVFLEAL